MEVFSAEQFITPIAALLGAISGSAGLAIGILNYLRERPRLVIRVILNAKSVEPGMLHSASSAVIWISNGGRRPVYVCDVLLFRGRKIPPLRLSTFAETKRLEEGSPPLHYQVPIALLGSTAAGKPRCRAVAVDSAGRRYKSPRKLAVLLPSLDSSAEMTQ